MSYNLKIYYYLNKKYIFNIKKYILKYLIINVLIYFGFYIKKIY